MATRSPTPRRASLLIAPLTPDSWDPDAREDAANPVLMAELRRSRRGDRVSGEEVDASVAATAEELAQAHAELDRLEAAAATKAAAHRRRRPTGRRTDPEADLSGRLVVRFPKSVHRELAQRARAEGVSLNQLVLTYVSRGLGYDGAAGSADSR